DLRRPTRTHSLLVLRCAIRLYVRTTTVRPCPSASGRTTTAAPPRPHHRATTPAVARSSGHGHARVAGTGARRIEDMAVEKVVIAVAAAMFGGAAVLPLAGTAPGDAPPPATATGLDSPADSAADHSAVNHYVALGDSYTSGPLVPEQRPEIPGCARSTGNYPSLLAQRLDVAEFTDVSCGGASTEHMTAPQE